MTYLHELIQQRSELMNGHYYAGECVTRDWDVMNEVEFINLLIEEGEFEYDMDNQSDLTAELIARYHAGVITEDEYVTEFQAIDNRFNPNQWGGYYIYVYAMAQIDESYQYEVSYALDECTTTGPWTRDSRSRWDEEPDTIEAVATEVASDDWLLEEWDNICSDPAGTRFAQTNPAPYTPTFNTYFEYVLWVIGEVVRGITYLLGEVNELFTSSQSAQLAT